MLLYYILLISLASIAAARVHPVWWDGTSTTDFGYGKSKDVGWASSGEVLDSPTEFKSVDVDFEVKGARPPV